MANIMSMKTIVNKPSRNGFDLSTKRNFTAKAGELLPVWCQEVIPGDKFKIDLKAFTRTQPVNTAAFARIREYYDFYYVPYHLLWNRANEVLSQMDYNQQHSVGFGQIPTPFSGELPYVTSSQIGAYIRTMNGLSSGGVENNFFGYSRAKLSVKLLEYLGYGTYDTYLNADTSGLKYNVDLNIMSLLAYQKIYSDWYRFQQWEQPNPSTFNVDYMTGSSSMNVPVGTDSSTDFYQNYNMFDLRYCNWPKDLYHGILPSAQYGDTAVVPIVGSGSQSFTVDANGTPLFVASTDSMRPDGIGVDANVTFNTTRNLTDISGVTNASPLKASGSNLRWSSAGLQITASGGSSEGSLSILALRQYEFLQKWKEIAQSGGQDYASITKRIWGVDVPNGLSDKCTYLGGIDSSLDINEVVNNNITDTFGAAIAGKGAGISNGQIEFNSDGQYGVLMCIYHCMPLVDYTVDYIAPMHTRVNAEDFANPVFDRVGMQSVSSLPILQTAVSSPSDGATPPLIGYAPRYIDYKTNIDLSVGAFKRSLQAWVVSYGYDDVSQAVGSSTDDNMMPSASYEGDISYPFFKVNPNTLDPILSVTADSTMETDQFLCSSFFDVKAVRNLDTDGLPY